MSVFKSTLSNIKFSATRRLIAIKFYLEHHWDGGKAALGSGSDRIRTLVSIATYSSHRVIMGKCCKHSSTFAFDWIFLILADNKEIYKTERVLNSARSDQRLRN